MIELKISGLAALDGELAAARSKIQELRPVIKKSAIAIVRWSQKNIKAEGALHEESQFYWPPLSPVTKRMRAAKRKGTRKKMLTAGTFPMLQDTGRLLNSFETHTATRIGRVINRVVDPQSGLGYAGKHEEGIGVPKRKIFPTVKQATREMVLPIFEKHVRKAVK